MCVSAGAWWAHTRTHARTSTTAPRYLSGEDGKTVLSAASGWMWMFEGSVVVMVVVGGREKRERL